jgi:tetratricopeptide (TPR) repeat protein
MRKQALACLLAVSLASASTSTQLVFVRDAHAQAMDADTKEAKKLFDEGVALYKTGKYEEARVKFKAAYGLKKRPSIIINLANAEMQTKRPLDAAAHYREVLGMADAKPDDKEDAKNGLAEVRKQLAVIQIDAPAGSAVTIDGEAKGTTPIEGGIEVLPGAHTVVVKVAGKDITEKVSPNAGGSITVKANKAAEPVTPPPVTPPTGGGGGTEPPPGNTGGPVEPPPAGGTGPGAGGGTVTTPDTHKPGFFQSLHWSTYASAGVTVVGAIGWVVFYSSFSTHDDNAVKLQQAYAQKGDRCRTTDNVSCKTAGLDEISQRDSAQKWMIASATLTILGAAGTVATYVLLRKKEAPTVSLTVAPTVGGASFSLAGTF